MIVLSFSNTALKALNSLLLPIALSIFSNVDFSLPSLITLSISALMISYNCSADAISTPELNFILCLAAKKASSATDSLRTVA